MSLRMPAIGTLVLASFLMTSCVSSTGVLNSLTSRSGYKIVRDIPYAGGARRGLDVYMPSAKTEPLPVIVFLYGGGWEEGNKKDYLFVGAALTSRGFITIIPDYRVYPEVRFPAFVKDAALAMRWTQDHAAEFGGDPNRILIMGHSAGAHIAAMLTFNHVYLNEAGFEAKRLKGLVGLSGPYDFLPLHSETLKIIFGPEAQRAASQPINFVDGAFPPVFLATGKNDDTVEPGNTMRLAEKIHARGGEATVKIYGGVGHATMIGAFAAPIRFLAPVLDDTVNFIRTVTGTAL